MSRLALLLAALATAAPSAATAASSGRVAVPLALEVTWSGAVHGSDALREEIESAIREDLRVQGCFLTVLPAGTPTSPESARLDVVLDDLHEDLRYDQTLAQYAKPDDPGQKLLVTARFSVLVRWSLTPPSGGAPVRAKAFRIERLRRPMVIDEDPVPVAREEGVRQIASETRRAVCRGSASRLARELGAR